MHIEQTYYGDYRMISDMPFTYPAIWSGMLQIHASYDDLVANWPITIDFNEKTGYWELWLTRPVSDQEYVEKMLSLPEDV